MKKRRRRRGERREGDGEEGKRRETETIRLTDEGNVYFIFKLTKFQTCCRFSFFSFMSSQITKGTCR